MFQTPSEVSLSKAPIFEQVSHPQKRLAQHKPIGTHSMGRAPDFWTNREWCAYGWRFQSARISKVQRWLAHGYRGLGFTLVQIFNCLLFHLQGGWRFLVKFLSTLLFRSHVQLCFCDECHSAKRWQAFAAAACIGPCMQPALYCHCLVEHFCARKMINPFQLFHFLQTPREIDKLG